MMNTGLYYYKGYYESLTFDSRTGDPHFDGKDGKGNPDATFTGFSLNGNVSKPVEENLANIPAIQLKTVYPGLLVGSGTAHEIGSDARDKDEKEYLVKNEFRLGLFFDHVTGLPVIPGSSIKGVLRHAFDHPDYIVEWLDSLYNNDKITAKQQCELWNSCTKEVKEKFIEFLKGNIFEGESTKSSYEKDVFYNASPTYGGKLFGTDYITHHEHPLKAPNPVQFIKVLPQITYSFYFRLFDAKFSVKETERSTGLIMSAFQKRCLYLNLISDLGLGAKTNVGYGQFEVDQWHEDKIVKKHNPGDTNPVPPIVPEPVGPSARERLETELETNGLGKPLAEASNFNRVKYVVDCYEKLVKNDLNSVKEQVFRTLERIVKVECENNQTKRKWEKPGKGNWHKVAKWFGSKTANDWYEQLKN